MNCEHVSFEKKQHSASTMTVASNEAEVSVEEFQSRSIRDAAGRLIAMSQ
jgi:hypothetical protein